MVGSAQGGLGWLLSAEELCSVEQGQAWAIFVPCSGRAPSPFSPVTWGAGTGTRTYARLLPGLEFPESLVPGQRLEGEWAALYRGRVSGGALTEMRGSRLWLPKSQDLCLWAEGQRGEGQVRLSAPSARGQQRRAGLPVERVGIFLGTFTSSTVSTAHQTPASSPAS